MDFALKYYDLYGISPAKNQIKNIGVDEISEHGGTSTMNEMTRRFCTMPSYPLEFPLKHPKEVRIDEVYEKKIEIFFYFRASKDISILFLLFYVTSLISDKPLRKIIMGK